jgi:hypothetical protein
MSAAHSGSAALCDADGAGERERTCTVTPEGEVVLSHFADPDDHWRILG